MGQLAMKTAYVNCLQQLSTRILDSADAYQVAALHPWLSTAERPLFEKVIFAHRRYPRLFAQSSYTPVSLIERLAEESDELILDKLAKNPTTPVGVLQQIAKSCQSQSRLLSIAKHGNASAYLLESLDIYRNPALHKAICNNPNAGLEQCRQLFLSACLNERKALARNPQVDATLLAALWSSSDETYLRAEIAAHPACPPDLLLKAVNSKQSLLRRKAATNPALNKVQLEQLLGDARSQVRTGALRHLGTKNIQLINEPARRVRRELARKTGLDAKLIEKLSNDEDSWVRRWMARNPITPDAVLRKLAQDVEHEVRRGVARNPLLPDDMQDLLAADCESWVRAGIAIRSDLRADCIQQLSVDKSVDVLAALGRNPLTPEELLIKIAAHSDRDVRRAVILNQRTPLTVLKTLLEDPYALNRVQLCRHAAMECAQLLPLREDPEPQVRFSAVQSLVSICTGKNNCRN